MKILVLLYIMTALYATDYSQLKKYKSTHPSITKEQETLLSSSSATQSSKVIVRFKNLETFDFYEFEKNYSVTLAFCVADGICAFTNNSTNSIEELRDRLKKEESLSSVKIYTKYNMRPY